MPSAMAVAGGAQRHRPLRALVACVALLVVVQTFASGERFTLRSTDELRSETEADAVDFSNNMNCQCEEYNCNCHKECFCQIVNKPITTLKSSFIELEETISAHDSSEDEEETEAATTSGFFPFLLQKPKKGKKAPPPPTSSSFGGGATLFKCGCDFGGVDVTVTDTQALQCDCSVAKCSCDKKCSCSPLKITKAMCSKATSFLDTSSAMRDEVAESSRDDEELSEKLNVVDGELVDIEKHEMALADLVARAAAKNDHDPSKSGVNVLSP